MRKIFGLICILALSALILSGCMLRTVDEMYCLPKRSETYNSLQYAINSAMTDLEYCAPIAGENQQTVQMADLDGDGAQEYLLFAKGGTERPLRILIFGNVGGSFVHTDTIACNGTAFDRVEYVQIDEHGGVEIVVGRMLSDQVLRTVSVYTLSGGEAEQLVTANYTTFLTVDLNDDDLRELFVIRPGLTDTDMGVAETYGIIDGVMERSNEVKMSQSAEKLKRILVGKLHDGQTAVYVASTVDDIALITDIYTLSDDSLINVTVSNESQTNVQTIRNYYVYAEDIDSDGVIELPNLTRMTPLDESKATNHQYLIRWYAMTADGRNIDKLHTYHNFLGGWYLDLDSELASRITVSAQNNAYEFYIWKDRNEHEKLMTVYVLTGHSREEQSAVEGRFVLHKSDSVIYAASINPQAQDYKLTAEKVIRSFHLIHEDWKTGET